MTDKKNSVAELRQMALKKANELEKNAIRFHFNVLLIDDFNKALSIVKECDEVLKYSANDERVLELVEVLEEMEK